MAKNKKGIVYYVYGGEWIPDGGTWGDNLEAPKCFIKKSNAESYIEELLGLFMQSKGYSDRFTIEEPYTNDYHPLEPNVYNITDKYGDAIYSVEMIEIDVSKAI